MSTRVPGLARLSLPAVLDTQAASPLLAALLELRGRDVELDGVNVQRLGGQCLQVLLAAQNAWRAEAAALSVISPSEELCSGLALFGVGPDSPLLQVEQLP